ncbi:MAG: hypothetical protein DI628_06280 [Blastochloris viridis]|uniref:DUF3192 domain-containing protein n=1 Tax=Blastochloris viridis TaxID=1079 RepID=A0A6N4R8G5_BLAVI|nr:MAG: hypothetical protein DI628_06280 [Blastochloris viridis]
MVNECAKAGKIARGLALGLAFLLVGCAGIPPFNQRQIVTRAPQPPQVVSSNSTRALQPCPPPLIQQTQWLARNMARLRLGFNKLQTVGIVGLPAHAETFQLANGAVIEVLFYHTPETICRVQASLGAQVEGLMPMVFQDDRLIGYGPNYYRDFIVPMLPPKAVQPSATADSVPVAEVMSALPQARVEMREAEPLRPAPARTGRWQQEDLPTPPLVNYGTPSGRGSGNGYTGDMQQNMRPAGYYETSSQGGYAPSQIGRGEPLQ